MAEHLDYEGVFGNDSYEERLMPLVYIDRIILENNSTPIESEQDPHIQPNRAALSLLNDPEYRQGVSESSKLGNGCLVTVDLVVKDILENDSLSSWFYDADLLKYMHVKIVQSISKQLTNNLIKGNMSALGLRRNRSLYTEKVLSLENYYDSLQSFYTRDNNGRDLVADVPLTTTFSLKDAQPKHLAYFAFCYFDIGRLTTDYNLNLYGYNNRQGILSKDIKSEIVIDNGTVVAESYVFYTPDGKIWTGAVHQRNGMWMAGREHTNLPHPILTRETVFNTKVQDFRDIDKPLEKSINLSPIESLFQKIKNPNVDKVKLEDNVSYFSKLFMSSDIGTSGQRNCNFTFSLDFETLFQQNSQFGSLFNRTAGNIEKQEVLLRSPIVSFKIYRQRVDKASSFNRIGSPVRSAPFKENVYIGSEPAPFLLIETGDVDRILKNVKSDFASIREIRLKNAENLRTFTVSDFDISNRTDGLYRYSVELTVKDGSIDYMNSLLTAFIRAKNEFELYNEICSSPDYYNQRKNSFTAGLKKHYNRMQLRDRPEVDVRNYPWVKAIARFCSFLKLLTNISNSDAQQIYQKLYSLSNATSGTPAGVNACASLLNKFESVLNTLLGDKLDLPSNSGTKSGKSSSNASFIFDSQNFDSLYDSENPDNFGINILNIDNKNAFSGPHTITVDDFLARIERENTKYFTSPTTELASVGTGAGDVPSEEFGDLNTYGASYLTPANVMNGDNVLFIGNEVTLASDVDKYTDFSLPIILEQLRKTTVVSAGQNNLAAQDFLGQQGISIMRLEDEDLNDPTSDLVSAVQALGDDDLFASDDIDYDSLGLTVSNLDMNNFAATIASDNNLLDYTRFAGDTGQISINCFNLNSDSCGTVSRYLPPGPLGIMGLDLEKIRRIPNQIKSLFFSANDTVTKVNWFGPKYDVASYYKTIFMFLWNYQTIYRVEYLSGFEESTTEGTQVTSPKWEILTFSVLENLRAESSSLVCRVVPHSDKIYALNESPLSKMPLYGSIFHIAANDISAQRINRLRPRRVSGSDLYTLLLRFGASREGSSRMNSMLYGNPSQRAPKNNSGNVKSPNKNLPNRNQVQNRIELLLDEASGVCVASIPYPERVEQETAKDEKPEALVAEPEEEKPVFIKPTPQKNPAQDDGFKESEKIAEVDVKEIDYLSDSYTLYNSLIEDFVAKAKQQNTVGSTEFSVEEEKVLEIAKLYVGNVYEIPGIEEPKKEDSIVVDNVVTLGAAGADIGRVRGDGGY